MSLLPTHEKSVHIDVVGNQTNERFRGDFTVKTLLTNSELLEAALAIDRMGGGSTTLPVGYSLFIRALAELDVRVVDAPKWWKDSQGGRNLLDQNVVTEIYSAALKAATDYKAELDKAAEKVEKATKEAEKKEKKSGQA